MSMAQASTNEVALTSTSGENFKKIRSITETPPITNIKKIIDTTIKISCIFESGKRIVKANNKHISEKIKYTPAITLIPLGISLEFFFFPISKPSFLNQLLHQ